MQPVALTQKLDCRQDCPMLVKHRDANYCEWRLLFKRQPEAHQPKKLINQVHVSHGRYLDVANLHGWLRMSAERGSAVAAVGVFG